MTFIEPAIEAYVKLLRPKELEDMYLEVGAAATPARLEDGGTRVVYPWEEEPSVPVKNIDLPEDDITVKFFTFYVAVPEHRRTQETRIKILLRIGPFLEQQMLGLQVDEMFYFDGPWYILHVVCYGPDDRGKSLPVGAVFSRVMLLQMAMSWKDILDDAGFDGRLSYLRAAEDRENTYRVVPPKDEEYLGELSYARVKGALDPNPLG